MVDGKPQVADFHLYDSKNRKKKKWFYHFFSLQKDGVLLSST
jgi:hypothetical protein